MRDLSKHYDVLGAHERFQLAIKAAARGDEADTEALHRTCPRKSYEMADTAVTDRFDGLTRLVSAYLLGAEHLHGKLLLHEVTEKLLAHVLNRAEDAIGSAYWCGWHDAGGKGAPPKSHVKLSDKEASDLRDLADKMLEAVRKGIMTRAKADLEAFEIVCRKRLGLDSQTVLAAMGASEALLWLDLEELKTVERLEDAELANVFISAWDKDVENLPASRP